MVIKRESCVHWTNLVFYKRQHSTQHTAHSTQHTAHSTQHTAHSTQHTAHSTQHTAHSTQHTAHSTQHTAHSTQHTAHSTQHTAHSTQHTAHSTQHTAHSTQHTAHKKTTTLSICCIGDLTQHKITSFSFASFSSHKQPKVAVNKKEEHKLHFQQVVHLLDYCCIIRWYT